MQNQCKFGKSAGIDFSVRPYEELAQTSEHFLNHFDLAAFTRGTPSAGSVEAVPGTVDLFSIRVGVNG
jgi:hypothetical protein